MPKKEPKPKMLEAGVGSTGRLAITGGQAILSLHGPLPPNHPLYARIGRVASEWAHIEHILDLIIWKLADIHDKHGACITSHVFGVNPRCKAIGALGASRLSANLLKKFRQLASDSFAVADLRARILHDPWYIEQVSGKTGQFKAMPASDLQYGIQWMSLKSTTRSQKSKLFKRGLLVCAAMCSLNLNHHRKSTAKGSPQILY
jgi:hypothetical protein